MKKFTPLLIGILVVGLAGLAMATSICPFDPPDEEQTIPSLVTTTATLAGTCEGSVLFTEKSTWELSGNRSGVTSGSVDLLTGLGITQLAAETTHTTQGATSSTTSMKAIDYQGSGASLSDTFYMSRVGNGLEEGTCPYCKDLLTGGSARFSSGMYGSELSAMNTPGSGMRITYQNGGGPTQMTDPAPTGMIGTMSVFGKTHAIYGAISEGSIIKELETAKETGATMSGKLNMIFSFTHDSFGAS